MTICDRVKNLIDAYFTTRAHNQNE